MSNLKRPNNPYLRGLRPKRFMSDREELMRENKRVRDIRKFDPDWNKGKRVRRA